MKSMQPLHPSSINGLYLRNRYYHSNQLFHATSIGEIGHTLCDTFVIDGVDGSGKQSTVAAIKNKLTDMSFNTSTISFPNYESASSDLVKRYLDKFDLKYNNKLDPHGMEAAFRRDRSLTMQSDEMIKHTQCKENKLIVDRYFTSAIIYNCVDKYFDIINSTESVKDLAQELSPIIVGDDVNNDGFGNRIEEYDYKSEAYKKIVLANTVILYDILMKLRKEAVECVPFPQIILLLDIDFKHIAEVLSNRRDGVETNSAGIDANSDIYETNLPFIKKIVEFIPIVSTLLQDAFDVLGVETKVFITERTNDRISLEELTDDIVNTIY